MAALQYEGFEFLLGSVGGYENEIGAFVGSGEMTENMEGGEMIRCNDLRDDRMRNGHDWLPYVDVGVYDEVRGMIAGWCAL